MLDRVTPDPQVTVVVSAPMSREAQDVLRDYFTEISSRYYGHAASAEEVDAAMRDEPSHDLVDPTGVFVLARRADAILGCGGVRYVDDTVGALTRIYMRPTGRGTGAASLMVTRLEELARDSGRLRLRLDTRSDLVEARAMYARLGYREVDRFNDDPYAQHWYSKDLAGG